MPVKRKRARKVPASRSKAPASRSKSPVSSRKKYKQWSEESMLGALKAMQDGAMGCNRAAVEYGVPKTTLKDRVSGRVIHGRKSGRAKGVDKGGLGGLQPPHFFETIVLAIVREY